MTAQLTPDTLTESGISPTSDAPAPASPTASVPQQSPVRTLSSEARVTVPAQAPDSRDAGGRVTTYSPDNLVDGDPTTAWRIVGDGTGQYLQLRFAAPRHVVAVGLINGYAKVDPVNGADRYAEERKVTAVTWSFDERPVSQYLDPGTRDVQVLSLDAPVTVDTVVLRIDGTTPPGDEDYDYTAISEVVVHGS